MKPLMRWTLRAAGSFIILSLLGAHLLGTVNLLDPSILWFTLFVGANLLQFSFTGFCPLQIFLKRLGVKD